MSRSSETTVVLPVDLHARPAGKVVRAAATFAARVEIAYGGKVADARGVLAVMGLGATAGSTVTVRSTGDDAEQAVGAVAAVLAEP
jgi:phosphotransferase system HPr (HPr) family protein